MKTAMIKLSLVENVNKFVNIVSRYPFDMDLRAGRHGKPSPVALHFHIRLIIDLFIRGAGAQAEPDSPLRHAGLDAHGREHAGHLELLR